MEDKAIKEVTQTKEEKIIKVLQFAQRAGKLKFGLSMLKILKNKTKVIIISNDVSESNFEKVNRLIENRIEIVQISTQENLGEALGRSPVSIIVITDKNFAKGIIKLIK